MVSKATDRKGFEMALSSEDRYRAEMFINWNRQFNKAELAKTSKFSERIDWLDGVLDALDSAELAFEYCDTLQEYVDELKTLYKNDLNSYKELRRTTNRKDMHYYHGSENTFKSLISHVELWLI